MSLPLTWVDRIFRKLTLRYGREFAARWDDIGLSIADVKTDWCEELAGFVAHPEAIAYALENLPDRPPTVGQFKTICRTAPLPEVKLLPAPKANPQRVAAELAKLKELYQPNEAKKAGPDLSWTHRIVQRVIEYRQGLTNEKPPGFYAQRCAYEVLGASSIDEAASKLGLLSPQQQMAQAANDDLAVERRFCVF